MDNVKKLPARLHYGRLKEVDQVWRTLSANVPADTDIETVMAPDYWAHYARDIRPMDLLWVYSEDMAWEAMLRVMFTSTTEVKTSLLWKVGHETADAVVSETHEIVWKGPHKKFCVVLKESGEIIADGLHPKSEAHNYLRRHLAQLRT